MDSIRKLHKVLLTLAKQEHDDTGRTPIYSELMEDEKGDVFISFLGGTFEIRHGVREWYNIYLPESAFPNTPIFENAFLTMIVSMAMHWGESCWVLKNEPTPEDVAFDQWAANADSDDGGH